MPPRPFSGNSDPDRRSWADRLLLITSLITLSWLAMQIVHEAGHVLGAWATGGTVTAVVLHPLTISRTDVESSQSPLAVVWAGPLVGTGLPLIGSFAAAGVEARSSYLWRFFAGFCLVANGVYIGSGVLLPVGDAADLVRLGATPWSLGLFGVCTS